MCVHAITARARSCVRSGFFDEKDSLDIRCFNKEASSKEAMGSISISLKDYAKPGSFQKSYPLTAKEKGSASGFLDFEFVVQGDSSAQVFRCPLEVVIAIQRSKYPDLIIPVFVRRSLEILRKNGMSEEGLFRKSGSTGDINWAIETLDKGSRPIIGRRRIFIPTHLLDRFRC